MKQHTWVDEFPAAITVCDEQGIVLEMNAKSLEVFEDDGGAKLIGTNALDCHPAPARAKMQALLDTQRANVYTIQKKGQKKLIYQAPWYKGGQFGGLVEIAFEIPEVVPNFNRDLA